MGGMRILSKIWAYACFVTLNRQLLLDKSLALRASGGIHKLIPEVSAPELAVLVYCIVCAPHAGVKTSHGLVGERMLIVGGVTRSHVRLRFCRRPRRSN